MSNLDKIQILVMDVDGVLTDTAIIINADEMPNRKVNTWRFAKAVKDALDLAAVEDVRLMVFRNESNELHYIKIEVDDDILPATVRNAVKSVVIGDGESEEEEHEAAAVDDWPVSRIVKLVKQLEQRITALESGS